MALYGIIDLQLDCLLLQASMAEFSIFRDRNARRLGCRELTHLNDLPNCERGETQNDQITKHLEGHDCTIVTHSLERGFQLGLKITLVRHVQWITQALIPRRT